MKIIVSIKQAPARDSLLRINSAGTWIRDDDLSFEINEPDAYALEEALQLKEKNGGEVIALCAGPARAAQTIREALANAVIHGNHQNQEKQVHVACRFSMDGEVLISVRDEGEGFDSRAVPDPTEDQRLLLTHGRGLHLMKTLMDEVSFEEKGRVVRMRKRMNAHGRSL